MKPSYIFLFLALLVCLAITWQIVPKEELIEYNITAEIGDVTSLNPSRELDFTLREGESATKTITFQNIFFSYVYLNVTSSGNITALLSYQDAVVNPFSSKDIAITVTAQEKGSYGGVIIIHATRFL